MKPTRFNLLAAAAISLGTASSAHGAEILKLSTGNLFDAAGWDGGVAPTTADIGVFDSSSVQR
jgi:hypothetical protein